jgi:hypothetical protein
VTPRTVAALSALGVLVLGGLGLAYARRGATGGLLGPAPAPLTSGQRVLLLGDSIGVGTAQHLADALGPSGITLDAEAHVGWTAKKVRQAYEADPSMVGDAVVISLGSNDAALFDPSSEADDVQAIVATAQARGAARIVWIIAPNYAITPPAPATPAKQATFLALVQAQPVELLQPSDDVVRQIGGDHIHLPPSGYDALGRQIAAYLTA